MAWNSLESLNKEKGVKHCGFERTRSFDGPAYSETYKGQVWIVRQSYAGARMTVEEKEIDPDRSIEIVIGATEDLSLIHI